MVISEGAYFLGAGGLISLLLSIIAFFLRTLVQDIRDLKRDQMALRELCIWLQASQSKINRIWESKNQVNATTTKFSKSKVN
ncbi:hypothetical protein [Rhodonellum sp.]|uniref:hypothetical protein n=1 Tax=Rhodonellum sp. TaxID=2231180 RepID=UPI002720062B|nr:hypothetical protein [Rhodonellum sp.]MDO9552229.1 hypothetical protein [Rhodonellum sp.]